MTVQPSSSRVNPVRGSIAAGCFPVS